VNKIIDVFNISISFFFNSFFKSTKVNFLGQLILDCDIIIYDLTTCDPNEAEYGIKTLKMGDFKDEKILICVSNVMVWAETPPKEKVLFKFQFSFIQN
jgi:hypothetical protein